MGASACTSPKPKACDATVNEIAALFPAISLQAVSKHLKALERAGLVTRGRTARGVQPGATSSIRLAPWIGYEETTRPRDRFVPHDVDTGPSEPVG